MDETAEKKWIANQKRNNFHAMDYEWKKWCIVRIIRMSTQNFPLSIQIDTCVLSATMHLIPAHSCELHMLAYTEYKSE